MDAYRARSRKLAKSFKDVNRRKTMALMKPESPPMGWNSWDCYGASVTEEEVMGNAEYMASHLRSHGFEYVVVDIQWYEPEADGSRYHPFAPLQMDEWGRLIPAVNRFPSAASGQGFGPLADRIHDLGLKFGIHLMRGIPRQAVHLNTPVFGHPTIKARDIALPHSVCPWNSDMYGLNPHQVGAQAYYDSLFALYASWGVDLVKVDDIAWSRLFGYHGQEVEMIHRAIDASDRGMVLSLSPGPSSIAEAVHLQDHATMWRVSDDFWDQWPQLREAFDFTAAWATFQRPGSYPDLDMLPLGHLALRSTETGVGQRWTRFTPDEQQTMVSLWAITRSPLMIGGELRDNDAWTLSLLTNDEILSMHRQGYGAREIFRDSQGCVWLSRHPDGVSYYLALFNWANESREMAIPWPANDQGRPTRGRNLWKQQSESWTGETVTVNPHGVLVLWIVPEP
jgi:hypothetical protein